ncbi:DUF3368 domain-containing protein [Leptolyngbya sp. CCNP1308]|uniref:DUF3368 domain-containing protein n=1 Tax=Leptolyngbya sp. CCNP1308 TaxID=3110255 RepID=UPI002B208C06|nr:DUF3368 domain-containing protein [Leptolyngbya sp. CCNP1308]MEA5449299.1 DUF3368 domain-containing protein [Leptolyngbya sp. CCNP1308]
MRVVSNTSPLSNLAVIGELGLLQKIYSKILIPPTVYDELIRFQAIQPIISNVIEARWLEVQTPQNTQIIQTLNQLLDPGEAAAIALAVDISADRLLIDERLGRSIASQYNIKIRGILGILVNAKHQRLIPATKPLLDRLLFEAGFRIGQTLYDRILQESGES